MSDEKKPTTELTPDEAQMVLNIIDTLNVKPASPNASEICTQITSVAQKCATIVRLSQPLASAAKPKLEAVPEANGNAPTAPDTTAPLDLVPTV